MDYKEKREKNRQQYKTNFLVASPTTPMPQSERNTRRKSNARHHTRLILRLCTSIRREFPSLGGFFYFLTDYLSFHHSLFAVGQKQT